MDKINPIQAVKVYGAPTMQIRGPACELDLGVVASLGKTHLDNYFIDANLKKSQGTAYQEDALADFADFTAALNINQEESYDVLEKMLKYFY